MIINIKEKMYKEPLGELFGIFFEDLNHAADGGLYAELIQNRSFEFCEIDNPQYHALTAWEKVGKSNSIKLEIRSNNPFCFKNPHYLAIKNESVDQEVGVWNTGFNSGIPLIARAKYYFTCYARSVTQETMKIKVSLQTKTGEVLGEQSLSINQEWNKYECILCSEKTTTYGRLAITISDSAEIELDFVSLFPKDTYKERRNGLRKDLAELLEQLRPKFMRFPGGCLVHDGTLNPDNRDSQYRWKNSIGPVEERPARRNNWNYNQTLGLGYYEYFQFCEDIGTKPLPVLPGGYDPHHNRVATLEELETFIEDALDLIEFANGDETTKWGAIRAAMGHKKTFGMEYIGIGNEEVGEAFFEQYPYFHKAIKGKYPNIKIVGTSGPFSAGKEYERGWKSARENGTDLVDEHYYQSPEWFIANHHRYDTFSEDGPKVFLGEYASQDNTWYNALVEASFMVGLQNNARKVKLACYAPLLCNVDYVNWKPDMIWFDQNRVFVTPNYYVQKLFMNHQGDMLLHQDIDMEGEENTILNENQDRLYGQIGFTYGNAKAIYKNIQIFDSQNREIHFSKEAIVSEEHSELLLCEIKEDEYTICCKAQELSGFKGLRLVFGRTNQENSFTWILGGWANEDSIIEQKINGKSSCLVQRTRRIECNRVYDLLIHVKGRMIKTYIDGELDLSVLVKPVVIEPIYCSSSFDVKTGEIIVKLVNLGSQDRKIQFRFDDKMQFGLIGQAYCMENYNKDDRNSFEEPDKITIKERKLLMQSMNNVWTIKKESICVLRLQSI